MEQHDPDPTTEDQADPWDDVSTRFSELGAHLKTAYSSAARDRGPSEEEIQGAFATLVGAWDQVAESISSALRDPATREQLKKAASSFANAVGTTLSQLGDEITAQDADDEEE